MWKANPEDRPEGGGGGGGGGGTTITALPRKCPPSSNHPTIFLIIKPPKAGQTKILSVFKPLQLVPCLDDSWHLPRRVNDDFSA